MAGPVRPQVKRGNDAGRAKTSGCVPERAGVRVLRGGLGGLTAMPVLQAGVPETAYVSRESVKTLAWQLTRAQEAKNT